jgi:hypothetical protein
MTALPKRRWFRFGLRTMFVVLAVLAIPLDWLAWQIQIVRERKAVLAEVESTAPGEFLFVTLERAEAVRPPGSYAHREYVRISRLRRRLGDESYWRMFLPETIDAELTKRVESAFPEAEISMRGAHRDSLYAPDREPNVGPSSKPA